jgi:prepilin-type N-terminal cleavage/methylation domain-containing protein
MLGPRPHLPGPLLGLSACPRARRRGAFTLVEVVVVMAILAVAMHALSRTMVSVLAEQTVNRETYIASSAAQSYVESLRDVPIQQIFALYNADPSDDPAGAGSAPGARFAVPGLDPGDAPDGLVGEIFFPTIDLAAPGDPPDLELREDVFDAQLGTPRDLNGDFLIDGLDHASDCFILPARVVVRWRCKGQMREYTTLATLCQYQWD